MNILEKIRVIEAFKNRREPESVHILADDLWRTLLILSVIGGIAIIGFNFWEFSDVGRALSVQPTITVGTDEKLPFEKRDLQMVVDGFAERKMTFDQYSTQLPVIADPSLVPKTKPAR
jgi:hypothetical protein